MNKNKLEYIKKNFGKLKEFVYKMIDRSCDLFMKEFDQTSPNNELDWYSFKR